MVFIVCILDARRGTAGREVGCKGTVLLGFRGCFEEKKKNFLENVWRNEKSCIFAAANEGALAQLARALAWHARGHRFDPDILHYALWARDL